MNDKWVSEQITEAIEYLRKNPDGDYMFAGTGNSFVLVLRLENDGEYSAIVTKDYYETELEFTERDYC